MSINVEVSKTGNESPLATIRKFSRKVQGTGLVKTARKRRYFARDTSKIGKKKRALKLLKRRAEYRQLVKKEKLACALRACVPFEKMAHAILGSQYELSLVICGDTLASALNRTYRKKVYPANVLSFPIGKNEGEIFLNIRASEREARTFGIPAREHIAHLFVHGCFHLKGYMHGEKMEREEGRILRAFGFRRA